MNLVKRIFQRRRGPIDNVSPRAQHLLVLARREADRFAQGSVGSEHLLLGLLAIEEGVGFATLKNLGANVGMIRKSVEDELQYGENLRVQPTIPARDDLMGSLQRAASEAKALQHDYLGTEHILLSLFRSPQGIVQRALSPVAADVSVVKAMVLSTLGAVSLQEKKANQPPEPMRAKGPHGSP